MNRLLPNLFGDAADPEEQTSPPATRSRTAAASLTVPPPSSSLPKPLGARPKPRDRTPSPRPPGASQQFFPSDSATSTQSNMADHEALRVLAETAAASAAAQASTQTAAALQNLQIGRKKPELPTFDVKHIDIWIRRTESAYIRAGISGAPEKFAFLESKIPVDFDPRINEYLYGEPTSENWNSFLTYLRSTYGKTRRQEAASILDGTRRDGRRPSQLLSKIKEKAGQATIDDIFKELIIREMPQAVRHSLVDRIDELTAQETADLADRYFDQEGRPLNQQSSVASVAPETTPEARQTTCSDEEGDINALGARPKSRFSSKPPQKSFTPAFGSNSGTSFAPRGGNNNFRPKNPNHTPRPFNAGQPKGKSSLKSICHRHAKYGEETKFCEPGCMYWNKMKAENDTAGWRK